MYELRDYDYELPPELIAQHPLPQRDGARLLVVDRTTGDVRHRQIRDLPELLRRGDCLVFNDTRVVPARLFGTREATGGKWEGLYLSTDDVGRWRMIGQTRGRLQPGERIVLRPVQDTRCLPNTGCLGNTGCLILTLISRDEDGVWTAKPEQAGELQGAGIDALDRFGSVPLPPYIQRNVAEPGDRQRYQTVFAEHPGAVAAPTAGLHFTPELIGAVRSRGVETAFVTLHVGLGTFRPIATESLSDHRMHAEWCRLSRETAEILNRARTQRGRVIAVGTTAVRTLQTSYARERFEPFEGQTDLFLRPPCAIDAIDGLLTNFHLPKSSLFVLVCAFLGREFAQSAYREAIRARYRFYSYGDAMLIV